MGSFSEILCTHCNFKITLDGVNQFYIDEKSNELVEYMSLMLTKIDYTNKIFGHIERTYCPDCGKLIKTYIITESEYPKEESINKLEEIIKKSDINEKDNIELLIEFQEDEKVLHRALNDGKEDKFINNEFIEKFKSNKNILTKVQFEKKLSFSDFETVEEFSERARKLEDTKINCPQCDRILYRNFHLGKCPICEHELIFGHQVMID